MESEDADTGISGYLLSPKGGPDGAHRGTGTTFSSSVSGCVSNAFSESFAYYRAERPSRLLLQEADGVAKALKVIRLQKERLLAEGLG